MVDRTLMVLMGELDGSTAASLRQVFLEVNTEYVGDVVLDIALLTFIDSTGLSLFVTEQKQLRTQDRELIVFAPTPMARRLFEITGLDGVLSIEPRQRYSLNEP